MKFEKGQSKEVSCYGPITEGVMGGTKVGKIHNTIWSVNSQALVKVTSIDTGTKTKKLFK